MDRAGGWFSPTLDRLARGSYKSAPRPPAQVVELVDTLDSGSSAGNSMEVRVLSWALEKAPVKTGASFFSEVRDAAHRDRTRGRERSGDRT